MPSGSKPLPGPKLTQIYTTKMASLGHNEFRTYPTRTPNKYKDHISMQEILIEMLIIKIRQPWDHLNFIIGITARVGYHPYIKRTTWLKKILIYVTRYTNRLVWNHISYLTFNTHKNRKPPTNQVTHWLTRSRQCLIWYHPATQRLLMSV